MHCSIRVLHIYFASILWMSGVLASFSYDNASYIEAFGNHFYVGGINYIVQLDKKFNIVGKVVTGPFNGTDNHVRILTVNPDVEYGILLFCGSVGDGVCHVFNLDNITKGDFLDTEYFVDQKLIPDLEKRNVPLDSVQWDLTKSGVFGHLGSNVANSARFVDISSNVRLKANVRGNHILLASSTWDHRDDHYVPALGFYSFFNFSSGYYIMRPILFQPEQSLYSWLTPPPHTNFQIIHRAMLTYGDYVYTVSVQVKQREPFTMETKIARMNKTDPRFTSYIEVLVSCILRGTNFNIALSANIGAVSEHLAQKLHIDAGDDALFLLQGRNDELKPHNAGHESAVCVQPLLELERRLNRATQRCGEGNGKLALWYHGGVKTCETLPQLDTNSGIHRRKALAARVMTAPPIRLVALTEISANATMIHSTVQADKTIIHVGTDSGVLLKIDVQTGNVFANISLSTSGAVQKDYVEVENTLVLLAGNKVTSVLQDSCSIYETAAQCVNTNDPLGCGWCDGRNCTTEAKCWRPSRWFKNEVPPSISSFEPRNGSVTGNTVITVRGANIRSNMSTHVTMEMDSGLSLRCYLLRIDTNVLTCRTGKIDEVDGAVLSISQILSDGTQVTGDSSITFHYFQQPSNLTIEVLNTAYGEKNKLAIFGMNVNIGRIIQITVGRKDCSVIRVSTNELICEFRGHKLKPGQTFNVNLTIDGIVQSTINVVYNPGPPLEIEGNSKSFVSGGTTFCLTSYHARSATATEQCHVIMELSNHTVNVIRVIQGCTYRGDGSICSATPDITPYVMRNKFAQDGHIKAKAHLKLGDAVLPLPSFTYYENPVVFKTFSQYLISSGEEIAIQGEGFQHGNKFDYRVEINEFPLCHVKFVAQNELKCTVTVPNSFYKRFGKAEKLPLTVHYAHFSASAGTIVLRRLAVISTVGRSSIPAESTKYRSKELAVPILSVLLSLVALGLIVSLLIITKRRRKITAKVAKTSDDYACSRNAYHKRATTLDDLIESVKNRSRFYIDDSRLVIGCELGSGCFGLVLRGTLLGHQSEEASSVPVAIKTLKGTNTLKQSCVFVDEAMLMGSFKHENILSLIGISFDGNRQPMAVLPFMSGGDLQTYLRHPTNNITLSNMLQFAVDIASGMSYLQHVLCVHRDLAARNCMLDANLTVKVADFGLSRDQLNDFKEIYLSLDNKAKLPVKWMAPESIKKRLYSSKSDMWSYGVTVWEIFSRGLSPYADINFEDLLLYIDAGNRLYKPEGCPSRIYTLLLSTWENDPEKRPDFAIMVSNLQLYMNGHDNRVQHDAESVIVEDYLQPISNRFE